MAKFGIKQEIAKTEETTTFALQDVLNFIHSMSNMDSKKDILDAIKEREEWLKKDAAKDDINKVHIGQEVKFTFKKKEVLATIVGISSEGITVTSPDIKTKRTVSWGDFTFA